MTLAKADMFPARYIIRKICIFDTYKITNFRRKKMKKKLMTLAIALGLSLSVLTGCSKPTVESLIDGLYDKEIESQTANVEMEIELSIGAMGSSFDVSADGDFEVQYSVGKKDAVTTYLDGDFALKIPVGSIDEKLGIEAYSVADGETITSYGSINGGEWYMTEIESDDSAGMDQEIKDEMMEALKDVLKENGELAEDTEKVEGEECYVITATIEGRDWADICKPIQSMLDDAIDEAMDEAIKEAGVSVDLDLNLDMLSWLEYASVDVTYYISKDTGYLVKAEMDLSGTDLDGMVKQMIKDIGQEFVDMSYKLEDEFGGGMSAADIEDAFEEFEAMLDEFSVSLSKYNISVVYSDINDTEVKVPDDVIDNAIDAKDAVDDFMDNYGDGLLGIDDSDIPDPVYPVDPDDLYDPNGDDPDDDWYRDGTFTFNKDYEDDEFLCEVKIPNGWTIDPDYSDPTDGLVCVDNDDGNGWIWVQNHLSGSIYYGLLNDGECPVDDYSSAANWEDYNMEITVIGTAFGGSDVMLVEESYKDAEGWVVEENYICIEYDDGGYREFLCVDLGSLNNYDSWSEDDFLDLAVSLFGR